MDRWIQADIKPSNGIQEKQHNKIVHEIKFDIRMVQVLVYLVSIIIILLTFFVFSTVTPFITNEVTITVTEKEYAGDTFLVWDQDGNVYKVDDSIIAWRFDSSNDYHRLKIGHTYAVTTRNIRVPLFSIYPNIVKLKEVKQ